MKTKIFNSRLWLILMVTIGLFSCKKDKVDSCSGAPGITKVSTTLNRDEGKDKGNLSDWIIIQGTNLCDVNSVSFNSIDANLKDAFINANEVTIRVPRGVPSDVNNKIILKTSHGTAEYNYTIIIPPLSVERMLNEYTPAGETMVIIGKNFDLYEINPTNGKVIFGTTEVAIDRATSDSVYFKVPANAAANTVIKLKDKRNTISTVPGFYSDNRGIIYDMETPSKYWNSAVLVLQNGPVPTPIANKYAYWKGKYLTFAWNEAFHVAAAPKLGDYNVVGSSNNFTIKFEMNVLDTWKGSNIKIKLQGITYTWVPPSGFPVKTKGWETVRIPLNVFKVSNVPITITPTQAATATELRIYIHGATVEDLNMAIDNFRIVPND
uniref:glycan-binding surface protein n=1 Tax=Pedobacter schmidteae TaxID=2201271 RepID=UPI000EB43463|nr:glycan-binding surface protein [Pedobacter schmidteae]